MKNRWRNNFQKKGRSLRISVMFSEAFELLELTNIVQCRLCQTYFDIWSCFLPGRTFVYANPNPVMEEQIKAQHEAKNRFIHDTDFSADDRTKPRKKSSAPRPNSKNEVRPKKFFAALRAKDPYPLSTDGTEMIGTDVFGSYDHTYIASP